MILILKWSISHFLMEMFLAPLPKVYIFHNFPMVYIFRNLFVLRERVLILMISTTARILFLTTKLFKQGYRYHKIRKAFSILYHRHSELIVKYKLV